MKTRTYTLFRNMILITALLCFAAPHADAQRGQAGEDRPRRGQAPEQRIDPSYVEQWLDRLRTEDPEEYERLSELRETSPLAFRIELRRRVSEARTLRIIREEHPSFYAYLSELDREERDRLGHLLLQVAETSPMRPHRHRRLRMPQIEANEEVHRLFSRWEEAETEAEQDEALDRMRATIGMVFDRRTAQQEAEIERLEEQLARLRDLVDSRNAQRDEWIERTLQGLLERAQNE